MHAVLSRFVETLDPLIRRISEPVRTVAAVEPLLKQLVSTGGWLEDRFRRPIPTKPYAQYLLYRPEDYFFSVVSFVWNPGQGSPVHDHCTWGVIGQYEGEEEETRFRVDAAGIERVSVRKSLPGEVSHVYPPGRDVHQIMNRTSVPTISIHVYGGDIGSQRRHVYAIETGEVRPFVSGYDLPGAY